MAFVEEEDVYHADRRLLERVFALGGIEVRLPLERISYDEAMLRYGSDRPDRRLGVEIVDLTEVFRGSQFKVFGGAVEGGGAVRALRARGEFPRGRIDKLEEKAKSLGAKGLAWAVVEGGGWRSPIAKFLGEDEIARANEALQASEGDLILFGADRPALVARVLGGLRADVAEGAPEGHDCFWVVDFPMFEWSEDERRFDALHHPFTSPSGDLEADPGRVAQPRLRRDPRRLGARRRFDPHKHARGSAAGLRRPRHRPEEAHERFGFLLEALTLRRAAARRHRIRHRPHRRPAGRTRLDPRRDRLPEDRQRRRPAHRRARARGRASTA